MCAAQLLSHRLKRCRPSRQNGQLASNGRAVVCCARGVADNTDNQAALLATTRLVHKQFPGQACHRALSYTCEGLPPQVVFRAIKMK
jgi:hypothetical protein